MTGVRAARRAIDAIAQHPVAAAVAVAYVTLRVVAATTHAAAITPDSTEYLGGLTLRSRPPVVPLVNTLLSQNVRAIVAVQATFGAICWLILAGAARRLVRARSMQHAMVTVVLLLGLCDTVIGWDSAILAESLAISLGVLLLACLFLWREQPTHLRMIALLMVALLWAETRELNAAYLLAVSVLWLIWSLVRRSALVVPAGPSPSGYSPCLSSVRTRRATPRSTTWLAFES